MTTSPIWDPDAVRAQAAAERRRSTDPAPLDAEGRDRFDAEMARLDAAEAAELALLLDETVDVVLRFVAMPSTEAADAVALWIAHTWVFDRFDTTPRLAVLSPELGSGKTRLLEVVELLARSPMLAANVSVAVLFRLAADRQPTVLLDEADAIWSPRKGGAEGAEDLRALLNAGYRRGAAVWRMVGQGAKMEATEFPVFTPVALAAIGDLPDTVQSRSIVIRMRRRRPDERVEQMRARDSRAATADLRARLDEWSQSPAAVRLADARPHLPPGITDRLADVFEPLIAIGDAAGLLWGRLARQAAIELSRVQVGEGSLGVRLLADIRAAFEIEGGDRITSARLCQILAEMPEAPWGDMYGKSIDPRRLARLLKPWGITSKTIRPADGNPARGFFADDFADVWARYLPPPPQMSVTSATSVTSLAGVGDFDDSLSATRPLQTLHVTEKNPVVADVTDVTEEEGGEE